MQETGSPSLNTMRNDGKSSRTMNGKLIVRTGLITAAVIAALAYFCYNASYNPDFSAIVPIIVGDSARAISIAKTMRDDGFFVSPIRYPSVPEGSARLRLTIMSSHTESELTRCAESLARAIKKNE